MGVATSEVGYTSATTARGDHEVHTGHVVAFEGREKTANVAVHRSDVMFVGRRL
jgi:hypothetical protein